MGSSEDGKSSKSEKSSPPATEQNAVHVYPDWAAMQAYYGPRVALPPYFNSAIAPGHPPPPYIWGPPPQPMVPPYGPPYAAIYAPGGVYAHPAMPLTHGQGVASPATSPAASEALVVSPLSIDTPAKSPGNADKGLMKKLKGFDGLAMSVGNVKDEKPEGGATEKVLSQSGETEDSSNGSDGNTEEADKSKRKRSREGTPTKAEAEKTESKDVHSPAADKVLGVPVTPANAATGQVIGTIVSPSVATTLELRNSGVNMKGNSAVVSPPNGVVSSESWFQNERELKRERRKQSNRESARRSRLRKQAETEELARRVESLSAENIALKSELNQLGENSQKLRLENAALMEKLSNLQSAREVNSLASVDIKLNPSDSTENLLSKINNNGSIVRGSDDGTDMYEKTSKSGAKFRQLLNNPRADAVAAG